MHDSGKAVHSKVVDIFISCLKTTPIQILDGYKKPSPTSDFIATAQSCTAIINKMHGIPVIFMVFLAGYSAAGQANTKSAMLHDAVLPRVASECPPCACGGHGLWTRVAHLDMSDPCQECPANWKPITTPVRACGRSSSGGSCDSASFPSGGRSYSRVCGRINAYQQGSPSAFEPSIQGRNPGLEGVYIEGVSLTHGAAGSRQHIWTFAAALAETGSAITRHPYWTCSCANTNLDWPYTIPSFIGNDYFCDTGNPGPSTSTTTVYADNPMWDGQGCGSTSTCCEQHNPPWFCTALPKPTTDDLEVRICMNEDAATNEDVLINLIDIYVM